MKLTREYIGEELAIFWDSPYGNGREKIASFWWPCHPPDKTHEVEQLFEALADKLIAASDSPVIPDSSPERVALRIAKNMLVALRREACNDEMPELSEELTSVIQVVDAAVPEWIKVDVPAVADTRDPSPEEMLRGASELEAIAEGIRGAVAGRVTPFDPDAAQLDTREREWSLVRSSDGVRFYRAINEADCDDMAARCAQIQMMLPRKEWRFKAGPWNEVKIVVDADTPSDKEPKA